MKAYSIEKIHAVAVNFEELELKRIRLVLVGHPEPEYQGACIWYEPTKKGFKDVGPVREELEAAYQELLKGQAK